MEDDISAADLDKLHLEAAEATLEKTRQTLDYVLQGEGFAALLSAGEALLAWARRELMWQPIKTIPIGPEARFQILYACSYCGDAWSYNGKVWVADEDGCDEQVDLDEISHWRPILDTEPGKLPDPLEAFAEALKRVRGE